MILERELYCQETDADLDLAIPESGFLRDYYDYAGKLTDAPEHYHLFVGLVLVSAVLGNKVYVPGYGNKNIYPNLWVILLAPSSFFRKTTSLNIGRSILGLVDRKLILPSEFTPEALTHTFKDNPQGTFIWNEFAGVLAHLERSYMLGSKEFLTDIFDCPPFYERKTKNETVLVENPCISIMAASTIEWLNSRIKEGDLRGGFLNRFLYVPATAKSKIMAFPPEPDESLGRVLAKMLTEIRHIQGQSDLSQVKDLYSEWYKKHESSLARQRNQEILSGFYTRLADYTLKFSLIYQASSEGSLVISSESMQQAIALTEHLKRNIVILINEDLALSPESAERKKLLSLIPPLPDHITRGDLTYYSHLDSKKVEQHMRTLIDTGKVSSVGVGEGRRKALAYYKNPSLHNSSHRFTEEL